MVQQARAVKMRHDIILATAKIIDEKNYEKASLKEIARRGGFTQGAVYYHFSSKENLAHAVIEAQNSFSQKRVTELLDKKLPALETMLQGSAGLTRDILDNQLVRAGMRLFTEVQMFSQPTLGPWEEWKKSNSLLMERGLEEGDLKEDLDVGAYADFISGAYAGVQLLSGLTTERANLRQKVCDMWIVVLTAMTKPERTAHWVERAKEIFLRDNKTAENPE